MLQKLFLTYEYCMYVGAVYFQLEKNYREVTLVTLPLRLSNCTQLSTVRTLGLKPSGTYSLEFCEVTSRNFLNSRPYKLPRARALGNLYGLEYGKFRSGVKVDLK